MGLNQSVISLDFNPDHNGFFFIKKNIFGVKFRLGLLKLKIEEPHREYPHRVHNKGSGN